MFLSTFKWPNILHFFQTFIVKGYIIKLSYLKLLKSSYFHPSWNNQEEYPWSITTHELKSSKNSSLKMPNKKDESKTSHIGYNLLIIHCIKWGCQITGNITVLRTVTISSFVIMIPRFEVVSQF